MHQPAASAGCWMSHLFIFCQCGVTVELWSKLQNWLSPHLILSKLDLKNALLGYTQSSCENRIRVKLINHNILIFKKSLYEMRSCKVSPSILYIVNRIRNVMDTEYQIDKSTDKLSFHFKKWEALKCIVNPGIPNNLSVWKTCFALYFTRRHFHEMCHVASFFQLLNLGMI